MTDEAIPTERAIKNYIDKVNEMKLDPTKFFEEYLQTPAFQKIREMPAFDRITDLPREEFTMSTAGTVSTASSFRYDDYVDDLRFRSRYCGSDAYYRKYENPCEEIKMRGIIGPGECRAKKKEKPKQTVFQFDPTGMTDEWKKPKT